jgi:hypothetical protein
MCGMNEFQIVAIRAEVQGGVEHTLQVALEEADQAGWDLKTLVPYREGLLAVFVRKAPKPKVGVFVGSI